MIIKFKLPINSSINGFCISFPIRVFLIIRLLLNDLYYFFERYFILSIFRDKTLNKVESLL